jgi:hypothetical protein
VTRARATGLAAIALLAPAAAAEAGPPGSWTRVTPAGQPVQRTLDPGLARTPDGALQLLWPRQAGSAGSVMHSSLSADARRLSAPRQVAGYEAVNDSVALVATGGGLRAFFAGLQPGGPLDRVMAAASFERGSWSAPSPASNPDSGLTPYAAAGIAAGVRPDGTPVSAWGSPGAGFHFGLDPGAPDGTFTGGGATGPGVGVDSASGQVIVAWNVLETGAVSAVQVGPIGPRSTAPGPRVAEPQHRMAVSGRIGAPGVFVAYLSGGNQFTARPALWRFGSRRARLVSSVGGARDVSLTPAPGGRLWVFWHRDGRLYATRSDPGARRFGSLVSLASRRGTVAIDDLAGEGSRGPLDLVALLNRPRAGAVLWHQRVLPALTLARARAGRGRVTLRVSDAGVPVPGARVRVGGARGRRSSQRGTASFRLARGAYKASAVKAGYAPASLRLRVR